MADGETTPKETPKAARPQLMPPWQPGQSGNPAGRPKGSRNKLTEDFFREMAKAFEQHGAIALAEMIREKPGDFIKTVAGLQSKELTGEGGESVFAGLAITIND
jgi:hypothetical protein